LAESVNPLFGAVDHPTHPGYTPGGSSGGESALLALNGSVLGLGTDIAGSVRIPAAFASICSLKPSVGRISRGKNTSTNPGIETLSSVIGPMARTVDDLEYFTKVLLNLNAWELDQTVLPLPYREEQTRLPAKLRIGYYTNIGLVDSSPACKRAVLETVEALRAAGHDVFEFTVPDMPHAAGLAASLLTADKGKTVCLPIKNDPLVAGVKAILKFYHLPWWMTKLQVWSKSDVRCRICN
jgi:Asp-tRNA(Asn)/Glu-tRNA(Gln) amidotransferase A subunit family amidase